MTNNKTIKTRKYENITLLFILSFTFSIAYIRHDNITATISALCGITYTFLAGKGSPNCYLFGIIGSVCYSLLSFKNALWGNLLLYAGYYVPMQIAGYILWNKNLKTDKKEIVKIKLPKQELGILLLIITVLILLISILLLKLSDQHPILDGITTITSIGGMYLTVKRAIEQWLFWFVVNLLSFIMWLFVVINGEQAYSTLIMWFVYLCLAVYFYYDWKKELK